ncbi:Zinc finger CCCH domain-containing protein 13, partial [Ophiophagus hannah]
MIQVAFSLTVDPLRPLPLATSSPEGIAGSRSTSSMHGGRREHLARALMLRSPTRISPSATGINPVAAPPRQPSGLQHVARRPPDIRFSPPSTSSEKGREGGKERGGKRKRKKEGEKGREKGRKEERKKGRGKEKEREKERGQEREREKGRKGGKERKREKGRKGGEGKRQRKRKRGKGRKGGRKEGDERSLLFKVAETGSQAKCLKDPIPSVGDQALQRATCWIPISGLRDLKL